MNSKRATSTICELDMKDNTLSKLLEIVNTPIVDWKKNFGMENNYGAFRVVDGVTRMQCIRNPETNKIVSFRPLNF